MQVSLVNQIINCSFAVVWYLRGQVTRIVARSTGSWWWCTWWSWVAGLWGLYAHTHTHTHTHTRLIALCPRLPGWADTRKVKPIWILLNQNTVSGSGISWAIRKSASRSRQTTTTAPHQAGCPSCSNQQRQSTEGTITQNFHSNK